MTRQASSVTRTVVAFPVLLVSLAGAPVLAAAALDQPTFVTDVAPILHRNCASCHSPGEAAPMPLRTYDEVRPWAKSIGKAVANRDMPPWDADPGYGPFTNDISLSDAEIDLIGRWVAAGAPKGEGEAPPPPKIEKTGGWTLGEPDYVFEFDPIDVPAEGDDQFHVIPMTSFEEDKWIEAVEILPGNPKAVHHFILWRADQSGSNQEAWLSGWAAGAPPNHFPETTARLLPKGRKLLGDFHYHPYGEATTDKTRVGVHFAAPAAVQKEFVNLWVLNADFKIPAGDPNYGAKASYVFPQDAKILSLTPHMHYRGKDMRYTAVFPDGTSKELLKVSRYDFNWQTNYDFVEPVLIPAGTRIDVEAHWDNSEGNLNNPDPKKDVTWGPQSTDEMLIGFVDYVVVDGVSPKPVSLVLGKLAELSEAYPGQVWRVDIEPMPGSGQQPTAVHLPKGGGQGGWYIQIGSLVLPAPIKDVVWDGNKVTASFQPPGQQPMTLTGTVDPATGEIEVSTGGGSIKGTPAEREAKRLAALPNG